MQGGRVVAQSLGDDWVVEMEWPEGEAHGGPGVVLIRPAVPDTYPPGGLSSTVLRGINFREAVAQLQRQLAVSERRSKAREKWDRERVEQLRDELAKGVTPDYLALLSSLYASRVNKGRPKPVESIAEDLGKGLQTIRGHLWQARKQGLLTGSTGRKGGHLTDETRAILRRLIPGAEALVSPSETITVEGETPPRVVEDKPKRRRPQKAIKPRSET